MRDAEHVMPQTTIRCSNVTHVFALASLLQAGCAHTSSVASGTDGEAPPPHLRRAAAGEPLAHVDQAPDPTADARVSLGGMLAYADQHAPVLAVARSSRARAEAARAKAAPLVPGNPELSVAAGPRMANGETSVDLDVSLLQQIEIAGERGLRFEAADRMRELTDAEVEQVRWFVHCDVHAAFHEALMQEARARLADRVLAFQLEVLRVVERQIASGEVAPLALRLAQAEVAQAKQVLVAAQQGFRASRIRLATLSGWTGATPPMPAGSVDAPQPPPPQGQLLELSRQRVPTLRAYAARVREAQARAAVADRETWTKPSIGVQYRREGSGAPEGATDIVMGVVSLPIPSFQTNQGERAQARADALVAAAELEAAERTLAGEIAQAHSEVVAAAERANAYASEIVPRFEENLTMLKRSFELGEIDILALSTGRERFLQIQSAALAAQLDYFVALAALERVVGIDLWHDDHHEESSP